MTISEGANEGANRILQYFIHFVTRFSYIGSVGVTVVIKISNK